MTHSSIRFFMTGFCFIFCTGTLTAQDITGTWQGRIFLLGDNIRVVFHIKDSAQKYVATMDSPDQNARGIEVEEIFVDGDSLYIDVPYIGGDFSGVYNKEIGAYIGRLDQHGLKMPLRLFKGDADDLLYKRPQKPLKPYPYHEEDVTIINKAAGDTLSGTFTKPNGAGKFPAVIMISGSGAQDRDETILAHKPFLILSDYLTRKGFAVLRCDDRGTAKSTGNFGIATSADFANDVEAQLDYLKTRADVDTKKIGLIGHSEGGIIAPMVAAKRKDIAFIVLMAAPSIDLFDLLLIQDSLISMAKGESQAEISKALKTNKKLFVFAQTIRDSAAAADSIDRYLSGEGTSDRMILASIRLLCSPWIRWYIGYDPRINLAKLNCAVLAINGEKDVQVPAEIDIHTIDETLKNSGNKNFKTAILPGLNHLFQQCKKCTVSEYVNIEETINFAALNIIGDWMEKNFLEK